MNAPIESISAADLWDYVNDTLDFGHSSATPGFGNSATRANTCAAPTVRVDIRPERGALKVDIAGIGVNPRIIAHIRARGSNCIEDQWGFPSQKDAYWVVDRPTAGGQVRSRFFEIDQTTRTVLKGVDGKEQYLFRACQDSNDDQRSGSVAKFVDKTTHAEVCAAAHLVSTPSDSSSPGLQLPRGSAWISCLAGCCTANAT